MKPVAFLLAALPLVSLLVACDSNAPADDNADNADNADATPSVDAAPLPDATPPLPDATPPSPDAMFTLACTLEEMSPIATCAQENCAADLTAACIGTSCFLELLAVSPGCSQCVITGIATQDLAQTAAACVAGLPPM